MNTFVFAVCGPAAEIQTMNFSLQYLRRFTRRPIRVVTDLARNEADIGHDDIIDYRTPARLNHAQAAILLKTNLHRILPMPGTYCYLDSDVIAVRTGVDAVFTHKRASATFATEWTRLPQYSEYAINCGCLMARNVELERLKAERSLKLERWARIAAKWNGLQQVILRFDACPPELEVDRTRLRDAVRSYWHGWDQAKNVGISWKNYITSRGGTLPQVVAALGYHWDEAQNAGYDALGRLVWAQDTVQMVERITGCKHDRATGRWVDPEGDILDTALIDTNELDEKINYQYQKGCDHLRQAIRSRFGVEVANPHWRHWNSGVYVFNQDDAELLDLWHRWSIAIFDAVEWETRDQGALIAAVWKLGLERQGNLPIHFNFLADYDRTDLAFDPHCGFSIEGIEGYLQPFLVHIYHHFGDRSWPVWKWIERIGKIDPNEIANRRDET